MRLKEYMRRTLLRNEDAGARFAGNNQWLRDELGLVVLSSGKVVDKDDACACERCGATVHLDDTSCVNVSRRCEETWCSDCTNSNAFECAWQGEYYSCRYFSSVCVCGVPGEVCFEANSEDLYIWDSDGEYHSEPEPEEIVVSDYHSERRPWKSRPPVGDVLGVELEMECRSSEARTEIVEKARELGFIAERDGSLSEDCGLEIVGSPMKLKSYRNGPWKKIVEFCAGKSRAWDAGTGVGMHVSINGLAMSNFDRAKLCVFINANRRLCEVVAGRDEVSWSRYVPKSITDPESDGKYEAVNTGNPGRLEVRIFRSTLKFESFLKNVQFCAAARDYVRQCGISELAQSVQFVDFVAKRKGQFKELYSFLCDKGWIQRPINTLVAAAAGKEGAVCAS